MVGVGVGDGTQTFSGPQTCPSGQSVSWLHGIICVGVAVGVPGVAGVLVGVPTPPGVLVGVGTGGAGTLDRMKASIYPCRSPGTRLVASESNATQAPSRVMLGGRSGTPPFPGWPWRDVLISVVVSSSRSRTYTCELPCGFTPRMRLLANEPNATKRPSPLMLGGMALSFAC